VAHAGRDLLFGWCWADAVAGLVIAFSAIREAIAIFSEKS
jgi:divalent metal cation (Fe/Co/Zn/Cd) transporter